MITSFKKAVLSNSNIITEAAIVERLKTEYNLTLDPHVMHAGFIYDIKKREILASIYKQYFDIAVKYQLPIMTTTPTRRANINRVNISKYASKSINADCYKFIDEIRKQYPCEVQKKIFIGGLMGCKNDAYKANEALNIFESYKFCEYQVKQFVNSKVDFILAAVLPAVSEAKGIAKRLSEYNIPYILSFVIRDNGKLLDGTSLHDAISEIDSFVTNKPIFYNVNCVHTSVLLKALKQKVNNTTTVKTRLKGIQANASKQTPEQLEGGQNIVLDTVENIVNEMLELNKMHNISVLGGCCGTNEKHLTQLAIRLTK